MIDLSKLKELVSLMSQHDLAEVCLTHDKDSIHVKRAVAMTTQVVHTGPTSAPVAAAATTAPATAPAPAPAPAKGLSIDSPMVGTFYSKPNPDAKSFVTPGQSVGPDTVVCIIEAMKVFNEIKAEKSGVIESMLVKDGQAVEFGQKLFTLK